MTSHREAPRISQDPVADNTDLYAFVSPDKPDTVTVIANYIPLEEPAGGPNFNQFGDDVLYEILIDNDGDGKEDVTYQFRFKNKIGNPDTFLYNTGPISSLDDPNWNMRQFYSVTKVLGRRRSGDRAVLAKNLASPPVNIGPRSTPKYTDLANSAIHDLNGAGTFFAGQRDEAFFVDLGSIFDLAALRPVQSLHLIPTPGASGVDTTKGFSVHTIAAQIPKSELTDASLSDPTDPSSSIGIWATASRRRARVLHNAEPEDDDDPLLTEAGQFIQVSRLGEPLINEVIIPLGTKDFWNNQEPYNDSQFLKYYTNPELQNLLPVLYPGVFPNLASLLTQSPPSRPRNDLVAILLTGIPNGVVPGFSGNFTGSTQADLLRLNLAISPASNPSRLGLLGGDVAGFPNGRRVADNVIDIELKAVAGAVYNLVNPSFTPDSNISAVSQGVDTNPVQPPNTDSFLSTFPYLPHPVPGYEHSHDP